MDIPELVLTALALACHVDREAIDRTTLLRDLEADSLTLVAVLARIEASCGVEFAADDMLALFDARDIATLIRAVENRVALSAVREPDQSGCA
jgi:acyl carrier protein